MLRLNNVQVIYSDVILVLKGLSLEVAEGQIVALLGANGAGKTTTLKAISGLLKTESGRVTDGSIEFTDRRIDGMDPEDICRRGIVQVMEGRKVLETLTVEENLRIGAYTRKDPEGVQRDLRMIYDYFPVLVARRHQVAGYLSGGEQQMLVLGRALMAQPKLLLLDEPSLGLAPLLVREIFDIIRKINDEQKTTFLLVEQNAQIALRIADYGYIMENGRIVFEGPAAKLRGNEDVREFYLGLSEAGRFDTRCFVAALLAGCATTAAPPASDSGISVTGTGRVSPAPRPRHGRHRRRGARAERSGERQADGEPDAAGGHLHRSLHDQPPLHPELEVTRKRADEVILAPLHRSLEGDLAGIARSHQRDLGDDLISHGWRNVARLLSCVRGLVHEGFRLGPLLEQDEVMAQRLYLAHGLEDDPQLLTRLCIDHGWRVAHVVADFYLDHLDLPALTLRGGDRAQEEDAGGHDRGQTAGNPPSSDLDHLSHRPFPPLGFWSRPRLETPWVASRLLGSLSSRDTRTAPATRPPTRSCRSIGRPR